MKMARRKIFWVFVWIIVLVSLVSAKTPMFVIRNAMIVDGNGAETISGAANKSTTTQWAHIRVRPCPSFGQWVRV